MLVLGRNWRNGRRGEDGPGSRRAITSSVCLQLPQTRSIRVAVCVFVLKAISAPSFAPACFLLVMSIALRRLIKVSASSVPSHSATLASTRPSATESLRAVSSAPPASTSRLAGLTRQFSSATSKMAPVTKQYDYIVVGGGSGGSGTARRASGWYGAKTCIIDAGIPGGCCVNVG
jgi:hypothetical protein